MLATPCPAEKYGDIDQQHDQREFIAATRCREGVSVGVVQYHREDHFNDEQERERSGQQAQNQGRAAQQLHDAEAIGQHSWNRQQSNVDCSIDVLAEFIRTNIFETFLLWARKC